MQSECCGWLCVILFPSKPSEGRRGKASVSPRGRGCLRKKTVGQAEHWWVSLKKYSCPPLSSPHFLKSVIGCRSHKKNDNYFKKKQKNKKHTTEKQSCLHWTLAQLRGVIMVGLSLDITDATLKVDKYSPNPQLLPWFGSFRSLFSTHNHGTSGFQDVFMVFLWNLFLFLPAENNFSQVLSEHKPPWCPGRPIEKQEGRQIVHLSYPVFNSLVPNVFWITSAHPGEFSSIFTFMAVWKSPLQENSSLVTTLNRFRFGPIITWCTLRCFLCSRHDWRLIK